MRGVRKDGETRLSDVPDALEGEILDDGAVVPGTHDVTPGWITRNRATLEQARAVARTMMLVAPPHLRIPLALASLAADSAMLAEDMRRRIEDTPTGRLRGAALVLEGAATLAVTRCAPARLATNIGAIEAARRVVDRMIGARTAQ